MNRPIARVRAKRKSRKFSISGKKIVKPLLCGHEGGILTTTKMADLHRRCHVEFGWRQSFFPRREPRQSKSNRPSARIGPSEMDQRVYRRRGRRFWDNIRILSDTDIKSPDVRIRFARIVLFAISFPRWTPYSVPAALYIIANLLQKMTQPFSWKSAA